MTDEMNIKCRLERAKDSGVRMRWTGNSGHVAGRDNRFHCEREHIEPNEMIKFSLLIT